MGLSIVIIISGEGANLTFRRYEKIQQVLPAD